MCSRLPGLVRAGYSHHHSGASREHARITRWAQDDSVHMQRSLPSSSYPAGSTSNNFALSQHDNHRIFSACWSRCEIILREGGGGGSGRNRTHDLLITRQASYHYRSPRLPDGYGWFDSHNSRRYCVDLSINDLLKIITSTKLFNIINSTQPK